MNVLFVCSQNRLRSPTAEAVFSAYDKLECLSAGTDRDAVTPISADLIEWAELIFVMENRHREKLRKMFGKAIESKRLIVLRIPDEFELMEPGLIELLKQRVPAFLPGLQIQNRSEAR